MNIWRGDDGEPRPQFNLRSSAGDGRWGCGVCVDGFAVQTAGDAVDLAIHGPRWRKRG